MQRREGGHTLQWIAVIVAGPLAAACGTTATLDSNHLVDHADAARPDAARPEEAASAPAVCTAATDTDAGSAPPEYCIPSCIWKMIRDCVPPPAAVCHSTMNGPEDEICDAAACWSRSERPAGSMSGQSIEIRHAGAFCVGVYWGGASPIHGYMYNDGAGAIAILEGQSATCGAQADAPSFTLDPTRPECKPWGLLPPMGPPLPDIPCEKTSPGPCETVP